jgi:hypothetical protein
VAAGPQQRQQGEAGLPGANQVDLQGLPGNLEVGGAGLLPGVVVDGGVVDQDVEAAVAADELGGGPFGLGEVAGGEDDGVAAQGQLPGELLAMPQLAPVTSTTRVIAGRGGRMRC